MDRSPGDITQRTIYRGRSICVPADGKRADRPRNGLVRVHDRGTVDAGRNPEGKAEASEWR